MKKRKYDVSSLLQNNDNNVNNKLMTIALFSDSYLPTKSGVVTVVLQLREQLIKLGHKVLLITVETTEDFHSDDPLVYQVHSKPLGMGTDQFISLPFIPNLVKFLKKNNVELIHCHTEFGIGNAAVICAKTLKIPAICTTHTMWTEFYKHYIPMAKFISPNVIQKTMKIFYKRFNALIAVSSKARNLTKSKKMLPKMPSVIIPNAIDDSKFVQKHLTAQEKQEIRSKYGIKNTDVLLLFLGRLAEEKRVFELLTICKNVVKKCGNCKVMFVGNGPAYIGMTNICTKEISEGKIIFTGFVEWEKVHNFYESADIFITASLSEMHSMTILEAELSSLPIVTRKDDSYIDSIFDNENGYLCNTDEEMEEKIIQLISDEVKRKKFGKKSLEITKNFTIEKYMQRTLFVYDEVIKKYPKKVNDFDVMERMAKREKAGL